MSTLQIIGTILISMAGAFALDRWIFPNTTSERIDHASDNERWWARVVIGIAIVGVLLLAGGRKVSTAFNDADHYDFMLEELCADYNFVRKGGDGTQFSCTDDEFESWRDDHPAFMPSDSAEGSTSEER